MVIKPQDKRIWRPEGGLARKTEFESYTSISKFVACPVLFYKHYFGYQRDPVTPPAVIGRAVHETIAAILREKMLRQVELPLETVDTIFPVLFEVELFFAKNQPGGITWEGTPSPEQQKEMGRTLVRHWMRDIFPDINPRAVEEPFSVRMKGVPQFLYGRFDLITYDGFWDHKTGKQLRSMDSFSLQLGIYYVGYLDKYKEWPKENFITWLPTVGEGLVEAVPYSLTKTEVQQIINERIKPAMLGIAASKESGVWLCTCGNHKSVEVKKEDG